MSSNKLLPTSEIFRKELSESATHEQTKNLNTQQGTILRDLLRINPAMTRLETCLSESEIKSLRNLKKQRATQIRKLLKTY